MTLATPFSEDRTSEKEASEAPLVTICVPTIGRLDYLQQALQSVLEQTYQTTEVLLLDNASPGEAQAVLLEFQQEHPNARVLRTEDRVPMFANFNRGIRAARGKYIAFFHDDDIYQPGFLERYVALLEENPKAVFAGGNFSIIDPAGRVTRQHGRIPDTGYWTGREFIEDLIVRGYCALPTPGLVFRREAMGSEGFDESLPINWGDFPILMRIAERGEIAVSKDVRYSWRVHGANGSNIPFSQAIPKRTEVFKTYIQEYLSRHPEDDAFASRLISKVTRGHRWGLLWGWLVAADQADADACLSLLRQSRPSSLLLDVMRFLETAGASLARRRATCLALRDLSQRVRA